MSNRAREIYLRRTAIPGATLDRLVERIQGGPQPTRRWWNVPALVLAVAALFGVRAWFADPPLGPSSPIPHVQLAFDGEGQIGGTRRSPVITWKEGTLTVQVTPNQGVDLAIVTPEAVVRVVGTVFVVRRAHHATVVDVSEGIVHVACAGEDVDVHAGEQRACLPTDASTLLLRAAELTRAGADAAERLATLDDALDRAPSGSPVRAEILAQRVRALTESGAVDQAVGAAEAYLDTGETPRRAELLAFVARTRHDRRGCAAVAALERAVAELPPGPERVFLARCVLDAEPERAKSLLEDLRWADPDWRAAAEAIRAEASR